MIMKSKEEIETLAYEVASLEEKIKNTPKGKSVQKYMRKIENIMESLSLNEGLALCDIVDKTLKND